MSVSICCNILVGRLIGLFFTGDDTKYGINAYRYEFVSWAYNRTGWEGNEDCFVGVPELPNGIADVSFCYWG